MSGKKIREQIVSQRFCVVNELSANVHSLAKVSLLFVDLGLNICQQFTKTWGNRVYAIYDVHCPKDLNKKNLIKEIKEIRGVLSCELGHFSYGMDNLNSERICIVHKNQHEVLGEIVSTISSEGFKVLSQLSQSKGHFSYTVMDMEKNDIGDQNSSDSEGVHHENYFQALCNEIIKLEDVFSCDIKEFSPGSLSQLHFFDDSEKPSGIKRSSSAATLREDHDSGYESEDESDPMKTARNRSASAMVLRKNPRESHAKKSENEHKNVSLQDKIFPSSQGNVKSELTNDETETPNYYEGAQNVAANVLQANGAMQERSNLTYSQGKKLVIAMVGLPCRGKSFTARKLEQFLTWKGVRTKIFNAGKYRRDENLLSGKASADVFNSANQAGSHVREKAANDALNDLICFLKNEGGVGIFDATNSVKKRRQHIIEECRGIANVVFLEVVCDDLALIHENYVIKIQNSPDFAGLSLDQAMEDLKKRVANYESVYETVEESENISFIKIYNISSKVLTKGVYGRVTRSIVPYLSALHVGTRSVILVRAGLGKNALSKNGKGLKGLHLTPSDATDVSPLGEKGKMFAHRLSLWLKTMLFMRKQEDDESLFVTLERQMKKKSEEAERDGRRDSAGKTDFRSLFKMFRKVSHTSVTNDPEFDGLLSNSALEHSRPRTDSQEKVRLDGGEVNSMGEIKVMTSTLQRAVETAQIALSSLNSQNEVECIPMLNPINRGKFTNVSSEEVKKKHPGFHNEFIKNPFEARFPGGESYHDVVLKLEPVIVDIEQQTAPVLVVAHISTLQMLMAYFKRIPVSEAINIAIPMHSVTELKPLAGGGWKETVYDLEKLI